jgi:2-polyprenyl-6-methoxyphenol hydroxylase-like FAD-dependent oxidoreductase
VRQSCLDAGFPFEELHFWNPEGVQVGALPPAAGVYQKPSNNAIGRPAYYGILQAAAKQAGARIQTGVTIGDMTEHSHGVEVELATWTGKRTPALRDPDATSRRYDLVVGFDGARSQVRRHLFGDSALSQHCPVRPTERVTWQSSARAP